MHTDYFSALGAGPSFLFVSHELSYAGLFYIHEVINHAHAILGSIAIIQLTQSLARENVAAETILKAAF
jgi:hypothetical protein